MTRRAQSSQAAANRQAHFQPGLMDDEAIRRQINTVISVACIQQAQRLPGFSVVTKEARVAPNVSRNPRRYRRIPHQFNRAVALAQRVQQSRQQP